MGHESITELFGERFADADREEASLPTPVASALMSQTGAAIDDFVLAEVKQRLAECSGRKSPEGDPAVVRNGHHKVRTVLTGAGPVSVRIPRIRSRDGKRESFVSEPAEPFRRRTPHMDEVLAYTHLMGVSQGRMDDVMGRMSGEESLRSLSVTTPNRLKKKWSAEHEKWSRGSLGDGQWVCLWVDGIYMPVRGSKDKICLPVAMGTTAGGEKRLLAIEETVSESTE